MEFQKKNLSKKFLTELYTALITPRVIEEKMLLLLRKGRVSKWFSGIGQEAIAVGASMAMNDDDYILPMHRNLGVFTTRKVPLNRLFAQFQGKLSGFTKGRDRSFHFGSQAHHIIGMISHLGPQLTVANGIALGDQLDENKKVTLVFTGEGGTSEGDFHEALNIAAVWDLPVIFLIENNGYSISTPVEEQYKIKSFTEKGDAYGIEALRIDGNNVLEVYNTIKRVSTSIRRKSRPVLIEAVTFRMRGHEESANNDFVSTDLLEEWAKKDPILNFERFLKQEQIIDIDQINSIYNDAEALVEDNLDIAFDDEQYPVADSKKELEDTFANFDYYPTKATGTKSYKRFVDAINEGLKQSLEKHDNLVIMGQDIAEYGGVFKVTAGLVDQFGKDRIRNTPLCESGVIGAALGLCIAKKKAIVELQFGDFITSAFTQVINNLAKSHYRWGLAADVVLRMPCGAGTGGGPFHSQTNEAWFFHTPGLKIVYPSSAEDAKGLLNTAINDPNPYLFFEHKALYRKVESKVHDEYYTIEVGKANLISEGDDLSIVTYGQGVYWAKKACEDLNIEADILDLRSLMPWDKNAVKDTVEKNGRVLLLTEDSHTGSIMAEISAWISENMFEYLDAPVVRVSSLDTPIPFTKSLEDNYLANSRLNEELQQLLAY